MNATEEATTVVSVEELRNRAIEALTKETFISTEPELGKIKEADTYAGLLMPVTVLVSAYELRNYMHGPLASVRNGIVEQLARVEQEHAHGTSLVALRDRVVGIVTVGGYDRAERFHRRFTTVTSYEELGSLARDISEVLKEEYQDMALERMREVLVIIDDKIAQANRA